MTDLLVLPSLKRKKTTMYLVFITVTTPPGNDKQPALHNYPHLHDLTYTWGWSHQFKGNKSSSARPEAQISALGKGLRRARFALT